MAFFMASLLKVLHRFLSIPKLWNNVLHDVRVHTNTEITE